MSREPWRTPEDVTQSSSSESTAAAERQRHSADTLSERYSVECATRTLQLSHAGVIELAPPLADVELN